MNSPHASPGSSVRHALLAAPLITLIAWCLLGWGLRWELPVLSFEPSFNLEAALALPAALLSCVGLAAIGGLLLGGQVTALGGWSRLALQFLLGGAAVGAIGSWLGFFLIGAPILPAIGFVTFMRVLRSRGAMPSLPEHRFLILLAALMILAALAPSVESDGLRYHLAAPQEWFRNGRFALLPLNANSNLPAHLGILATLSGVGTLGVSYQLLNVVHTLAATLMVAAIVRLLASDAPPWASPLASLLFLSAPVVMAVGAWPFADLASVAYLLAASYLLAAREGSWRVGLLLGAAVATKLSALPQAGLLGLIALAMLPWRNHLPLIVAGTAVVGPWFLKSWLYHANPLYPLAYGVFGGPEWSAENAQFYAEKAAEKGLGRGALALLLSPWNVTTRWQAFEAHNPGPALLGLLLPALFVKGRTALTAVGLLALSWLVWFFTYQSVRFLLYPLALIVVLGTAGLASVLRSRAILWALVIASALWGFQYRLATTPTFQAALGFIGRDPWISARFNGYPATRFLQSEVEQNEPVYYIGEHRPAYAGKYRPVSSDWFDTPRILLDIRLTTTNEELLTQLRAGGVRFILLNQAELGLYEALYFRPRFTDTEWLRFTALREYLAQHILFEVAPQVFVIRLPEEP
jgi:hypothetical protein